MVRGWEFASTIWLLIRGADEIDKVNFCVARNKSIIFSRLLQVGLNTGQITHNFLGSSFSCFVRTEHVLQKI